MITENVRPNIEIKKNKILLLLLPFFCFVLFSADFPMHILLIVFHLPMHLLLIQLLHFSIFLKPCQFGYDCNSIKRKNFFKKEITSQHFLESCCCNLEKRLILQCYQMSSIFLVVIFSSRHTINLCRNKSSFTFWKKFFQ